MSANYWLGVDLGGTKILAGLFDHDFELKARVKSPTDAEEGPRAVVGRVAAAVEDVIRKAGVDRSRVRGMGLGVPGQVVPSEMRVRYAPNLSWSDFPLGNHLPKDWPWPVVLENDVRLGTYGEFARGAAKGARHVLGVFVGTGIGGGLILDGKLYGGLHGHAGELGHIVMHWRKGLTLEEIAGRRSLMKRAQELLADAPKRVRKEWKGVDFEKVRSSQLAEYYQRDDPVAVQILDDAARALGAAIGSMINLLSPEVIVVGGGVAGALGDSFLERIWEIAQRYALPGATEGVRCVAAALGDDSGIVGAAAYARERLGE